MIALLSDLVNEKNPVFSIHINHIQLSYFIFILNINMLYIISNKMV